MYKFNVIIWFAFTVVVNVWSMDNINEGKLSEADISKPELSIYNPVPRPFLDLSPVGMQIEKHVYSTGMEEHLRPDLRWNKLQGKATEVKKLIKKPESKYQKKAAKAVLDQVHSDLKIYKDHKLLPAHITDKMIDKHGKRSKPVLKKIIQKVTNKNPALLQLAVPFTFPFSFIINVSLCSLFLDYLVTDSMYLFNQSQSNFSLQVCVNVLFDSIHHHQV